jgi:hypothetical protein
LGLRDQAWSQQLSGTTHRIMDYVIVQHLSIGNSIIVESNFKADADSPRFAAFQQKYH